MIYTCKSDNDSYVKYGILSGKVNDLKVIWILEYWDVTFIRNVKFFVFFGTLNVKI